MNPATPGETRAAIAAHLLGHVAGSQTMGAVTLQKHQVDAARRLREILRTHGGALLADDVGLGKTFVALSVAAGFERTIVVAPASLRSMWRDAAERTAVRIRFVSMELLGHGATIPSADFLIVDEAHHFRNGKTRRYRQLADGSARCSVLLMSATPVQNELSDLRTILALVAGRRASSMTLAQLGALIVRRDASAVERHRLPDVLAPVAIAIEGDADCLDQLCALPPPLPPADGGYAHALLTLSLTRQWASSRAALVAALTRRLAAARAMEDALGAGRHLTRHELGLWRFVDGAQQLAFPELSDGEQSSPAMLTQVREHSDALRALTAWLRCQTDIDAIRAGHLGEIVRRHHGERVIAFSEFTETVATLFRLLAPTHRVALLTHAGGRVAGGALSRSEVLRQFGPGLTCAEHERIDLLLTTDVLSEGVDLHGASVIVHLDLTWNPARMEQRVGRLRRLGAARDTIAVYLFSPPAAAERLLELDRRLRAKLGDAARSVGLAGSILPGVSTSTESAVGRHERVVCELERWSSPTITPAAPVAAVQWDTPGALACVRFGGTVRLLLLLDGVVQQDPEAETLSAIATRDAVACSSFEADKARDLLTAWMRRQALAHTVTMTTSDVARSRRAIIDRVNGIARRSRRHERSSLAPMLGAARSAATLTMPAGAERVLDQLARASLSDAAWLRAISEFGAIHGKSADGQPDEILALLLLLPK